MAGSGRTRRLAAIALVLFAAAPAARAVAEGPAPAPALPAPRFVGPRLPGKDRDDAWKKHGGTPEAAKAIESGLDWLERHAVPDGGWDADGFPGRCPKEGTACKGVGKGHHGEDAPCPFDDALSAFAALALLGNGHLPDAAGDARARLLEKTLLRLRGAGDPWAAALATEAFAEAEALERKGRWTEAAVAGAKRLVAARGEDGAFGYIAQMRKGSDVPYTAFVAPALVAARDAGAELPKDLGEGVDRWLNTLEEKDGKLAYLLDGRSYGYTPTTYNAFAAASIREVLRAGLTGPRHRAHLGLVRSRPPKWEIAFKEVDVPGRGRMKVQMGSLSEMDWWNGSVALFQRGGSEWTPWYAAARSALVGHQQKNGCARGSWDPEGLYEREVGGRILSTALAVLILEQPVRHRRLEP